MAGLDLKVLIRGAGEMASGVGLRLFRSGFRVAYTDIADPLCVRRTVSFCEALHFGRQKVEGEEAVAVTKASEIPDIWSTGRMAVINDPELQSLAEIAPHVVVDAILAKRNLGTSPDLAELVVALGPGFTAGRDAHVVIETNRGHNLGRLIYEGEAEPDTRVPGTIAGESIRRVLRSPAEGQVETDLDIGAEVAAGQEVLHVAGTPVVAELDGILRGLIRPGTKVGPGLKIGDIDPRGRKGYVGTVSDKARAVGGAVLEAVMQHFNR